MPKAKQVSRQRLWQIRQKKLGLCPICAKPLVTGSYCLLHAQAVRDRERKRNGSTKSSRSMIYRLRTYGQPTPPGRMCIKCDEPAVTQTHCVKHALEAREKVRKANGSRRHNHTFLDRYIESQANGNGVAK